MPTEQRWSIRDVLLSFAQALDFSRPDNPLHHKRVAYLSYRIAERMQIQRERVSILLSSALLHDAGLLSRSEAEQIREPETPGAHRHGLLAYLILRAHPLLHLQPASEDPYILALSEELRRQGFTSEIAEIILYHHATWREVKDPSRSYVFKAIMDLTHGKVPLESFILRLADHIVTSIDPSRFILHQVDELKENIIKDKSVIFHPEVAEAFLGIADKDYIWLELVSPPH